MAQRNASIAPALSPVLNAYPRGTSRTSNPDIDEFIGRKALTWDEDSVLVRLDRPVAA